MIQMIPKMAQTSNQVKVITMQTCVSPDSPAASDNLSLGFNFLGLLSQMKKQSLHEAP